MSSPKKVYSKIKGSGNLPTLPEVLLKILSACDSEDTSISEIADIISGDPSLSAKVLQLVNSSYYGLRQSFSSIDQAVIYLGADTVKNLALTMSVHQFFGGKKIRKIKYLNPSLFWWQSLTCACIAKLIASKIGSTNSDEAYLGGLLHNLGIMTLASTFSDDYKTITEKSVNTTELLELETQILGVNHCEAGSWILRQWKLNPLLVDAILYHHSPLSQIEEAFPLVKIVYGASQLTEHLMGQDGSIHACNHLFDLSAIELDEIIQQAQQEVDALTASLGIQVSPGKAEVSTANNDEITAATDDAEKRLASRVKNISLLHSFLEQLIQAEDIDSMMAAFEKSVRILFTIDKVLFFLPDENNVVLNGEGSSTNQLKSSYSDLSLPVKKSTSQITTVYLEKRPHTGFSRTDGTLNLSDQQVLSIFDNPAAIPFSLHVKSTSTGVVVLGLPEELFPLTDSDTRLISMLVKQLSLCMNYEKERIKRSKEIHQERMAAISMTAKKFAHEINNPLGIISNYLVAMKMKTGDDHKLRDDVEIINEEINRISAMVSQMQMFSQAPFAHFERVDLNMLISQIVQLTKSSLFNRKNLSISFTQGSKIPQIITSKDAIKQILINLLKNSAEAMVEGGRTVVRTHFRESESTNKPQRIEIIISDNGPGLPKTVKKNLFKPFITTKQGGHSGLGLSIIHKAISDIGGEISCTTKSEKGTTFSISLPCKAPITS